MIIENAPIKGIKTKTGLIYRVKAVIFATGTFLNGVIIIGDLKYQGGPSCMQSAKVMSRHVVAIGALFVIAASLFPKLGAVIAIIPQSVLGGASIVMFSMMATMGIVLINRDTMNQRSILIVSLALGLGLGIGRVPAVLDRFPEAVRLIFGGSGIAVSCIIAIFLNIILPEK